MVKRAEFATGAGSEDTFQCGEISRFVFVQRLGGAFESFADDVAGLNLIAEQAGGEAGNVCALFRPRATTGERGRGADTLHRAGGQQFTHAPQQEGDIRALTATVGMEFVEDKKFEALGRSDELLFARPGEDELQHHIVREQDVGRARDDARARFLVFLAGIALERDRALAVGETEF